MKELKEELKECVSCKKYSPVSKGQYWFNNQYPLFGGPFIGFHCEECVKRGKRLFILALAILMVSGIVIYCM